MKRKFKLPVVLLSLMLAASALFGCAANQPASSSSALEPASSSEPPQAVETPVQEENAFDYSSAIDENGLWKNITAGDRVELCPYKGISIPKSVHEIADSQVQAEIDGILEAYFTSEPVTDRAVVDGDTVNIDFVGTVDGVAFDGGSTGGAGTDVTIGVTQYIDDFLQQLIGHKPGDSFDIHVTFPENYGVENLNGKDAVFATTINHIVLRKEPTLTDGFVAENLEGPYGWKSVEDMKSTIRNDMQTTAIDNYLRDFVLDNSTVTALPDDIVDHQVATMINYYRGYAQYYGVGYEEFLAMYVGVMNEEQLIESNKAANTEASSLYLIMQAIAEDAKINVDTDDVGAYFKEKMGQDDYSEYESKYGMPYLKLMVLNNSVLQLLKDHAVME